MPRVTHFEIHADQPERAMKFYESVLGWKFKKWDGPWPYWMIFTGDEKLPGINGGLMQRRQANVGEALTAYVCTIDVPNLDQYLARAVEWSASICVPKMQIPGVGGLAYCKDTEGNIFGMIQPDERGE